MDNNIVVFKGREDRKINKIQVFDNFLQLSFPVESEDEQVRKEWEKFRILVEGRIQAMFPDMYVDYSLYIETDLFIVNRRSLSGVYEARCLIQFYAQALDEGGDVLYEDISSEFAVTLSKKIRAEIKNTLIKNIEDCLFTGRDE